MKLNLGCGDQLLDGYMNIDLHPQMPGVTPSDVRYLREYEDGTIDEILAYHIIEHLPRPHSVIRPNAATAVQRWYELLCVGGVLIVECPDFEKVVLDYAISGEHRVKNMIFGLERTIYDRHLWGYALDDLERLIRETGFYVRESGYIGQSRTAVNGDPCIRVEGVKT